MRAPEPEPGLCGECRHALRLRSARSSFLRCARSDSEPGFPRYPLLPVLACPGFEPRAASGTGSPAGGLG
jgi:hypothetical protein